MVYCTYRKLHNFQSNMTQRALIIGAVVVVVIILGLFAYTYTRDDATAVPAPTPDSEEQDEPTARRIDATHFFSDGTHTIAGEVLMPTPCDLVDAEAIVRESAPEQVTIAFEVVNTAETCAQVVTPQRFRVDFDASVDAVIDATWNGDQATLNLIEAGPGEDPEDFELFIKG